jgi:hypothetical protein
MLHLEDGTKVYFKHITPNEWQEYAREQHPETWLENETGASFNRVQGLTMCTVEHPGFVNNVGFAACSKEDNFDRRIGRKVALTEALKVYDRTFRKEIWQKYLEKTA